MPALSSALAAGLPPIPLEVRSTSSRWLSVPPDTRSYPRACSADASATALDTPCPPQRRGGEREAVAHPLRRVAAERRRGAVVQRHRDGGRRVVVRPALQAREDCLV